MSTSNNYPSCIKVPASHSKQGMSTTSQKDVKTITAINYELISVANRIFGTAKWSHGVTSQTLDYVESMLGKFVCGCASFVRIQLDDGTFHEDMGYFCSEAATKALAIQAARLGSLANGFEKALVCFGNTVELEVKRVLKLQQKPIIEDPKIDTRLSLNSLPDAELLPCAQSTPYVEKKENEVVIARAKSPNSLNQQTTHRTVSRSRSPIDQREQKASTMLRAKSPIDHREHVGNTISRSKSPTDQGERKGLTIIKSTSPIDQKIYKGSTSSFKNHNQLKVIAAPLNNEVEKNHKEDNLGCMEKHEEKIDLSEEELLRQERKRKQMEKQAEYKRLLKEKELQKGSEIKKPNPKY